MLSTIRAHLINLLEGSVVGLEKAIPAGRFLHIVEDFASIPELESAPYPFDLADGSWFQPLDVPSSLNADWVWHGKTFTIRIAYTEDLEDQEGRQRTIDDDYQAIRRTVRYPQSWDTVSGWARAIVDGGSVEPGDADSTEGQVPYGRFLILEIPIAITFSEDYS